LHDHQHHHEEKSVSTLRLAFFLNLGFTIIEIVGGVLTNSVAILADAVHDLGDSLSLGLAWWFESMARRKTADDHFTYGYNRLSLLASLINAVVLTAGSTLILVHAIPRLLSPSPGDATGMMALAVLGIVVNGWAALRTSKGSSINESVISWHLLEDVLGWAAVLIGAIVIRLTDWWWIDSFLAMGIAAFILTNIVRRLWKIGRLFLQVVPDGIDVAALREAISSLNGVKDVHHLHIWSLDGEHNVATVHALLGEAEDARSAKDSIRGVLDRHKFAHVTIEIDRDTDDCSMPQDSEAD